MSALARLLFPVPDVRRSTTTLFKWWETRRITYNLIVGGTGLVTLGVVGALSWLAPHLRLGVPLAAVLAYGVLANLCYTFGFALEALLQRIWGNDVAPIGPALWRHGLTFSIGLTLFPAGIAWLLFLASGIRWWLAAPR